MLQIAIEKAGAQNLAFDGRLTAPSEMYLSVSSAFSDAHTGLDLAADEGAPVRAAAAGVVLAAGYGWDMGNYVLLYHGTGADGRACATLYGAMQAQGLPAPGQTVAAGEEIGRCGNSGSSTGPHLHVEVWLDGRARRPGETDGALILYENAFPFAPQHGGAGRRPAAGRLPAAGAGCDPAGAAAADGNRQRRI